MRATGTGVLRSGASTPFARRRSVMNFRKTAG